MRRRSMFVRLTGLAWFATIPVAAQITSNPLPEPIPQSGIRIEVRDLVRLPDTRTLRPPDQDADAKNWARVSYLRDLPDGRRFINDSRGILYLLDDEGKPQVYANFAEMLPHMYAGRLESGLIGFVFHPDFAANGLLYTVHSEVGPGNPEPVDFIPIGYGPDDVTYQNVITEWHANNPAADRFAGTHRTLLREAHVVDTLTHPMGAVEFNPTARPGDEDYGLLYTSGSDHGFSNGAGPHGNDPAQTQRLDSIMTAILRIDPRSPSASGGVKGLGDYTIPMSNVFAADDNPNTLGEIYAYGFRNAHRLSWDDDGTMFASDIGMSQIEEIDIVHNGGNYGWMRREAYFENARVRGGSLNNVYPLPAEVLDGSVQDGFLYPVAIYDHDEGRAVTDGFAYHGDIDILKGKFVFGDIQRGRVFVADVAAMKAADDGIPRTVAPVSEIQLYVRGADGAERDVTFTELVEETLGMPVNRADLHISHGRNGELFLHSRQDGMVRMLVDGEMAGR